MTDSTHQLDGSLLLVLQRATHVTLNVLATRLSALGLTAAEINALANLSHGRSVKVSELAAAMGSRPSTATSVLDRLEQRDLLRRKASPEDRRSVLVSLSRTGRTAARRISRELTAVERGALEGLPPSSLDGLSAGLHALAGVSA